MAKEEKIKHARRMYSTPMRYEDGLTTTVSNYQILKYNKVSKLVKPNTWLAFTSRKGIREIDLICDMAEYMETIAWETHKAEKSFQMDFIYTCPEMGADPSRYVGIMVFNYDESKLGELDNICKQIFPKKRGYTLHSLNEGQCDPIVKPFCRLIRINGEESPTI